MATNCVISPVSYLLLHLSLLHFTIEHGEHIVSTWRRLDPDRDLCFVGPEITDPDVNSAENKRYYLRGSIIRLWSTLMKEYENIR